MPIQEKNSGLTFAAFTGECIVVIPRRLISTHHTQLLPFDPAWMGRVSGPLAHSGHNYRGLLQLSLEVGPL